MKLQTEIPFNKAGNQIGYESQIISLGSCFAENIGQKLDYFKFRQLQNPFGILFHPLAIEKLIERAVDERFYSKADVFFHNERWHCYDAHSELSDPSEETLLKSLNEVLDATRSHIVSASHCIITLGTAWVYRHTASYEIVANCHKVPQREFSKELLSIAEIVTSLQGIIKRIRSINPNVQFIFTVSPVRHLKDGFVENQLSKAHLIAAIHKLRKSGPMISYFPSYEIMMDELRDYRFYKRDMVHPNPLAIDYIWEKFKDVWVSEESRTTMTKIEAVQKGLRHRAFNPDSKQHQEFLSKLRSMKEEIQERHPHISLD